MGTSIIPVRAHFPERANTLVPGLVAVPTEANQARPLRISPGTFAMVSTLLMTVGFPKSPFSVG